MKKFIILFIVLFMGSNVFAEDFNVYKLNNGQTVIIKQIATNPIVVIDTWIKTGSINETEKNSGISHFLEHLFFKGTEKNPNGTFDKMLESKGAMTNAATSKDFTHYYIKIPSKYFDLALNLHSDMLLSPQIPSKELEKERKVVLEEIAKDKNSPSDITYENLNSLIYTVHPYKREVIGDSKVIETVTREEILEYYKKHYAPENMITVIVGDVNPDEAAKKVEEAFKTKPVKIENKHYKKEPPITAQRIKEVKMPTDTGYMMIGFRGTDAKNNDEYALDILATILGEGRSSKFYQNIKEKKQLAFSIGSSNMTMKDDGIFFISAEFKPENKDKLKASIFEEINNIKNRGVTTEEVEIAKSIIERDTHYSRESVSNIATEIGYTMILTNNTKAYDGYLNGISKITPEDVKRVANKYLAENKCAISTTMPEKAILQTTTTSNIQNQKQHTAKLVKTAAKTEKYILDTDATLLLNKHTNNDIVAIAIRAKGGEFLEKVTGSGTLTASTMMKTTKNYSQEELAQIMEENGIKINPSSGVDYFSINVLTTKQQLPLTMKLLDEIVNNAKFDEYDIEKAKKNMINAIKSNRDVPLNRALEEYRTYIYENSIYSHSSKIMEQAIPKVHRENILDFYKTIFYPKNLVISINGDVDKDYMINEFSEIFKGNKGENFSYLKHFDEIPYRTSPKIIDTKIKDLQTSWLFIGWQTAGNSYLKDYAALQLIDTFMGTGMSSRLFRSLREESGLAYQVGTSYSPNVLKGAFTMYIGTNPTTLTLAKKQMLEQIKILKNEFVSEKELQEAKDQLIGKYILALETNLDKASGLALYEITGRGFNFIEEYPKLIQSITPSDIMEVSNKYFFENYVESVIDKAK